MAAALEQPSELSSECKSLYVGNLDPRVTDDLLQQIFSSVNGVGEVLSVKIIPDKNYTHGGLNYGFVEYSNHHSAEVALQTLNGRKILDSDIRVNWAFAGSNSHKEDTSNHFHIFVGDLSPDVNDTNLAKAFSAFGSLSDARVMWDISSGKSRGYGFVAFREKSDAEQAISTMNGEWLGNRPIRVNWANQKGINATSTENNMPAPTTQPLTYEVVAAQTPYYNTTVYVGNFPPNTTQEDILSLFQRFGYIVNIRVQADRGYAFIKFDTHENATSAIVALNGTMIKGRPAKCSWGKDKGPDPYYQNAAPPTYMYPMTAGYQYYPNPAAMGMNGMMPDTTAANPYYYGTGMEQQQRTDTTDMTQNVNDQAKHTSVIPGTNVAPAGMMANGGLNTQPPVTAGYEQYGRATTAAPAPTGGYAYDQYYGNTGHYFG